MKLPDGSLLELLQYQQPTRGQKKTKQLSNEMGVSHVAFTVKNMDRICEQIVRLGGGLVNEPALTENSLFKVAYCYDVEGNLFEIVEFSKWQLTIFLWYTIKNHTRTVSIQPSLCIPFSIF